MTIPKTFALMIALLFAFSLAPLAADDGKTAAGKQAAALKSATSPESTPGQKKPEEKKSEPKPTEPATTKAGPLAGHSYHGEVFNEGPRQKAYLMAGMPKIHFPVTTKSPQAQLFFEQGVGQLHGFWYYEAERSFRQAAMLDKNCAMAYWGMALANIENGDRAKKFMAECLKHKAGSTDREKLYIDAVDAYFKADGKRKKERNEAFTKAIEQILYKDAADIEARSLLALRLWKNKDGGTMGSPLAVDALLDQVLRANPMHPAHHYRIHLWDSERSENALASAALCGQTSPGIAHMWHMPGHIYSDLKRYDDACWQQEASARVDHAHMMRDRVLPDQIHNFAHNNEWLIRDMIFVGRMRDAIDLAKNMCELPRHPKYNTYAKGSARYGRMRLFEALTRFEAWPELIALCQTSYLEPTDDVSQQVLRLRHLGMAYYRSGNPTEGDRQLETLEKRLTEQEAAQEKAVAEAVKKVKQAKQADKAVEKASNEAKQPTQSKIAELTKAIDELKGHSAIAAMAFKGGLELLKKAGTVDQDYLVWVQYQAGEVEPALQAAEAAVKSRKNQVIPLSRLVELQWLAGKKKEAKGSLDQLREISSSIDRNAPLYARIAPIAKELRYGTDWIVAKAPRSDTGVRPPLDSLGPIRWQPSPAMSWSLRDAQGIEHSLNDYRGKPVIVLFFLGHGCLHCAKQVQAFGAAAKEFKEAGIEIIAVSSDDANGLKESIANYTGGTIPFPLVTDNGLNTFKSYRCFDDFENQALHGTFLVDGNGLVRWQDISYEPFQETKFLLGEAKRLLGQPAASKATAQVQGASSSNR